MQKFLNNHWWVEDLTHFEAPAGGVFDYQNCQHTGAFDQIFSKSYAGGLPGKGRGGGGGGMGGFGIDWYIT